MSRHCNHTYAHVPAVLPDGTIHPEGLLLEPDCDEDRCGGGLVFTADYLDEWDRWAEQQPWEVLAEVLDPEPGWSRPEEFVAGDM